MKQLVMYAKVMVYEEMHGENNVRNMKRLSEDVNISLGAIFLHTSDVLRDESTVLTYVYGLKRSTANYSLAPQQHVGLKPPIEAGTNSLTL
jgi:hypothetical protein